MVVSIENSSSAENQALVPQALQELFFLNRNSSTDHAWAPGLLKLSQCNWVAPVPMAFVIRNAPFFPFQAAAAAWVSTRVILEGRLKRNPLLLHK